MCTFPAAALWLPSPHGAAQGNGNKAAAKERWELSSAEQQLCSHGKQLNLPMSTHLRLGPHKCWELQLHEIQGRSWWNFYCPSHTALCCSSCCSAAGHLHQEPPWHHTPPASTFYPPPPAFAPPSALQLFFPGTQF